MSDTTNQSPNNFLQEFQKQQLELDRLRAELLPGNKAALFDALAAAGIDTLQVGFDGCADSGQIDGIEAKTADVTVSLPDVTITIGHVLNDGSGVKQMNLPIEEAIEQLAYDFLAEIRSGWENDDGAFGEFVFDVGKRSITLEFNDRYTETEYSQHSW